MRNSCLQEGHFLPIWPASSAGIVTRNVTVEPCWLSISAPSGSRYRGDPITSPVSREALSSPRLGIGEVLIKLCPHRRDCRTSGCAGAFVPGDYEEVRLGRFRALVHRLVWYETATASLKRVTSLNFDGALNSVTGMASSGRHLGRRSPRASPTDPNRRLVSYPTFRSPGSSVYFQSGRLCRHSLFLGAGLRRCCAP